MADSPLVCGASLIDLEARVVMRAGVPVHLSPKAFALLAALLRAQPRALSKAQLQDLLWPDTFVVEGNLANLVREVRRALEDDPAQPRWIRTVHGYGYAWQGPIEAGAPASPTVPGEASYWLYVDGTPFGFCGGRYVLGRGPESIVPLRANLVSRRHAQLVLAEDGAVIADLGSTNGTYVRGRRIDQPVTLVGGEEICIGPYRLMLIVSSTPEDQTRPAALVAARSAARHP